MRSAGTNSRSTTAFDDPSTQLLVTRQNARCELERARLTEQIVLLNLRFCDCLAGRFARKGAEWEDLVQVARTALMLAVQRFDPDRGMPFHAFAAPTITGELKRYLRDHCWTIRPPRGLQELRSQIRQVGDELTQRLGHAPDSLELADALEVSVSRVRSATAVDGAFRAVSLDEAGERGGTLSARTESASGHRNDAPDDDELLNCLILRAQLKRLTAQERQILIWRFRDDYTQSSIASRLGVSQMQVSRTLARLLGRLRRDLMTAGSDEATAPITAARPDGTELAA